MSIKTPRYLHKPMNFIVFDSDDLAVGIIVMNFLVVFDVPMGITIATMAIFVTIYRSQKKKFNRGFLKHIWYVLGVSKFKGFPNVRVKKFRE